MPRRYAGRLPSGTTTINEQGHRRLLDATILIAQTVATDELEEKTNALAQAWLNRAQSADSDKSTADLLAEAGALMLQIETADSLLGRMSEDRHQQITTWLNAYLNRKE